MINRKTILVTGGTGSFGKKFINILMKNFNPKKIIIYSRDEQKQFQLQQVLKPKKTTLIRFFVGDVRDLERLKLAMRGVDIVIHAAALKHIPIAEYNPFEVVKTNILGAQNVIDASFYNKVKNVIALSTDKASSPINLYGATKLTSDKLFVAANNYRGNEKIKFSVVRYGNVMGSRGSVIPLFLNKRKEGIFHLTHPEMTRFNITLDEGVDFVLLALKKMWGGEIFVPKIPSYRIVDVAKAISPKNKIKYIGIRPGEKIHEEMVALSDSTNTVEFSNHFVIVPNSKFIGWDLKKYLKFNKSAKLCDKEFSYSSKNNKDFLNINQIRKLIQNNQKDFE